jgi:3-isopropylmalate dehydratase small subunit
MWRSRENAGSALKGRGIVCVIAKSFDFIYGRNQPNLGALGITITDESFYDVTVEGADIRIDLEHWKITVEEGEWLFKLSIMETKLIETGGIAGAFKVFGKKLFDVMCAPTEIEKIDSVQSESSFESFKGVQW